MLAFVVILALTVLVWFAVAMSEVCKNTIVVKVEMTGFDRSQYAVVQIDSVMNVQVESTGFNALLYSLKKQPVVLRVNMNNEGVRHFTRQGEHGEQICRSVAVKDLGLRLSQEENGNDSLRLVLSERKSKVFRVDISEVKTTFAEGYGLYGEPTVTPSEVTLYGDEDVLSKIERVGVKPLEIKDLKSDGTFSLVLDTTWHSSDVFASTDKVTLTVPVEQYVEREYEIPIAVEGIDSLMRMNLYPDKATLRVWVPRSDVASMSAERFTVSVDYRDVIAHSSRLKTRLTRFPQKVRVHSLTPEEVKFVVIK